MNRYREVQDSEIATNALSEAPLQNIPVNPANPLPLPTSLCNVALISSTSSMSGAWFSRSNHRWTKPPCHLGRSTAFSSRVCRNIMVVAASSRATPAPTKILQVFPGAPGLSRTPIRCSLKHQGAWSFRVVRVFLDDFCTFRAFDKFPGKQPVSSELVVSVLRNSNHTLGDQPPNAIEGSAHDTRRCRIWLRAPRAVKS